MTASAVWICAVQPGIINVAGEVVGGCLGVDPERSRDQLRVGAGVIAAAFHGLTPSDSLIGDPAARREIFPGYFRLHVEHALVHGVVHTTPGRTAAALWIPAGPGAPGPPDGYTSRLAALTGPQASRFAAFDAALQAHHTAGIAHWHLAILAVRPDRQGHGTGTALLHAGHAMLDQAPGTPAYLEASSSRARDLYLRHGYILWSDGPFRLPGGGPPLWPMWREPRSTAGAAARHTAHEQPSRPPAARERM